MIHKCTLLLFFMKTVCSGGICQTYLSREVADSWRPIMSQHHSHRAESTGNLGKPSNRHYNRYRSTDYCSPSCNSIPISIQIKTPEISASVTAFEPLISSKANSRILSRPGGQEASRCDVRNRQVQISQFRSPSVVVEKDLAWVFA